MRLKQWWRKKQTSRKLGWLLAAALLAMVLVEALCNWQAFVTRNLTPITLSPEALSVDTDSTSIMQDADGVHVQDAKSQHFDLYWLQPETTVQTVTVTLEGEGVVGVSFYLTDESAAYTARQVYSVYCVADDEQLRTCHAVVQSNGVAGEVMVRLLPQSDDAFTLTAITLNAPIPFTWQPLRMAISFALALLILCAFGLRAVHTAYRPQKWSHRLAIALPLLGLMVFSVVLGGWIAPDTPLFAGMTDQEAAQSTTDSYAVLFETLRSGRLSVDRTPNEALSTMDNPYDQTERISKSIAFSFDYAYYNGQYYLYYGLAPILTVYAPYHLLTGRVPTSRDANLLMVWLAIGMIGWAVCGLARRYLPGVSVLALSLACITAVFTSGALFLFASADFYYLAQLSFVAFAAATIAFGLHATLQKRRRRALLQYALSGLCFALTAMSRPSGVLMVMALLLPLFLGALVRRQARFTHAAAFLAPALLGIGVMLWYNAARFGSPFDFGASYQLTVSDMHWQSVRLREWPQALYYYLLEPIGLLDRFPFLSVTYHATATAGRYTYITSSAGVLVYPVTWLAALWPLVGSRFPSTLRRERTLTLWLPLLVSLPLMLVSYGYAGAILRYTCDFRLFYALAGGVVAMALMSAPYTKEQKAFAILCGALCLLSIGVGFGMLFDNERDFVLYHSPQVFYRLQRMFFPY